jgi:hypothetical protein
MSKFGVSLKELASYKTPSKGYNFSINAPMRLTRFRCAEKSQKITNYKIQHTAPKQKLEERTKYVSIRLNKALFTAY